MSEELKTRAVCHACASQPRAWLCPVCDNELSALNAGQGEAVALPPQCTDRKEHVKYRCGWNNCLSAVARLNPLRRGTPVAHVSEESFSSDGTSDIITRNLPIGTALYTAPPAPPATADAVSVPRELLGRVLDPETGDEWSKACRELRALLARQEVKS